MNIKPINERALQILKKLVERYIRDGQPIGSKTLANDATVALSPATIRHIMADLENAGYLRSPHTSAGRVPTVQGYRLFVNSLLTVQPLEQLEVQKLQQQLGMVTDAHALVAKASSALSNITQLAGLVTLPRREHLKLRQVEFLPLAQNRLLVILVINDYEVQNRIVHTDRAYTSSELQQVGNYLTRNYAGKDLSEVRQLILTDMQNDRRDMEQMMGTVMEMAGQVFEKENRTEDYVMAGEVNLLSLAEESGIKRMRSLFDAFTQKRDILHLFDQSVNAQGLQIFIGEESGYEALDDCSVIAAPYQVDGKVIGVLGVIGPTRMAYDRVISAVDVTAKLLSAALGDKSQTEESRVK